MPPQTSLRAVRISQADHDALIEHARAEAPNECCGYLWARDGGIEGVERADNPRKSPYGYELDSQSMLAVWKLSDEQGYQVGTYHSHPKSPAEPSQTDINLASYPDWLYVIVSLEGNGHVRGWWIRDGKVTEEELDVVARLTIGSPARAAAARTSPGASFCPSCGMPLVQTGGESLEAPLSDAHDRARKINPVFTEGELVRVAGGRNQSEAEFIQGLLLEWGVPSVLRRSAGFDVPDFLAAGPRDVLVPEAGAETAREVLLQADLAPKTGERSGPRPLLLAAVVALGGGGAALLAWLLQS